MLPSKRRILALLALVAALATILAIGLISNKELSALADSSAQVQRSYDLLDTLDDLTGALTDTETNQRGFLLTQDPSYLTQYKDAISQIRLALFELRRLSRDQPETHSAVEHLETLASGKLADLQESIEAAASGAQHTAVSNLAEGKGKRLMEAFRRDSAELESLQRRLLAAVHPTATAKGVTVTAHAQTSVIVNADPARLQQIVWNLLTNAIKFTPRGGRVEVALRERGDHVEISVTDTGQGITAQFLPFVFDRFRQADASTTRRHGGLGLGLSIVKSLVELHGGTVDVHSPGEATALSSASACR